jgi:hypothetical protein
LEVNRLRHELQKQRLETDKMVANIDIYCARLDALRRSYKGAIDHNQTLSKNLMKSGDRNMEALNRITVVEYQHSCTKEVAERYLAELKVLRSQFNDYELLKQQHDDLKRKHQLVIDSLPDWAGGECIDDEDDDALAPDDSHRS